MEMFMDYYLVNKMVFFVSDHSGMFVLSSPQLYVYSQEIWHSISSTPDYATIITLGIFLMQWTIMDAGWG
ncbi:hypothetical protein OE88DRAFT_1666916 [Heliocybe sulcata]|uniref:Uncharacterized protein n=1 Tax=Heliocybe sulcata TaxID=5364 RepID=A0A5C3MNL5_9AGAM|nr:hypothetical protein OE88DRAFT_1666916 [Heliocybe sulcata]